MKPAHPVSIGLFGTCDNSKWREKFMECYEESDVSYFNPDAGDNWHPGLIEEENKEILRLCITKLKRCNYLLDEAYKHHCIAAGVAANDETKND